MKRLHIKFFAIGVLLLIGCGGKEGVTPLMLAAKSGDEREVKRMISDGVKLDARSNYGWTALMFAASQGRVESVRILLKAGADPNVVSGEVPSKFETVGGHPPSTALQEAIRNGHLVIANLLIKGGARIDAGAVALAGSYGDVGFLSSLVRKGADLNVSSENEFYPTPLCSAARSGKLEAVKWLIANGAKPNLIAVSNTALCHAVYNDHPEIVLYLLKNGANPNLVPGSTEQTALFSAVTKYTDDSDYAKNLSIIKMLLAHGADTKHKAFGGMHTALEFIEIQKGNDLKHWNDQDIEEIMARRRASLAHKNAVIVLLKNAGK